MRHVKIETNIPLIEQRVDMNKRNNPRTKTPKRGEAHAKRRLNALLVC